MIGSGCIFPLIKISLAASVVLGRVLEDIISSGGEVFVAGDSKAVFDKSVTMVGREGDAKRPRSVLSTQSKVIICSLSSKNAGCEVAVVVISRDESAQIWVIRSRSVMNIEVCRIA